MAMIEITCEYCRTKTEREAGAVNRAIRRGLSVYCGLRCSGLGRRLGKTDAEKREAKRLYDMRRRDEHKDRLRAQKAEYHRRTYDPIAAAAHRKTRAAYHAEYCRKPSYRAAKKQYDRQHRAKIRYGPLWESFVLTLEIREEALSQMTDYEIRLAKGTLNKSLQRRREYDRTFSKEPQVGPLGNLERGTRR